MKIVNTLADRPVVQAHFGKFVVNTFLDVVYGIIDLSFGFVTDPVSVAIFVHNSQCKFPVSKSCWLLLHHWGSRRFTKFPTCVSFAVIFSGYHFQSGEGDLAVRFINFVHSGTFGHTS